MSTPFSQSLSNSTSPTLGLDGVRVPEGGTLPPTDPELVRART